MKLNISSQSVGETPQLESVCPISGFSLIKAKWVHIRLGFMVANFQPVLMYIKAMVIFGWGANPKFQGDPSQRHYGRGDRVE